MVSWDLATTVSPSPQTGARPIAMEVLHLSDLKNRIKATAPCKAFIYYTKSPGTDPLTLHKLVKVMLACNPSTWQGSRVQD